MMIVEPQLVTKNIKRSQIFLVAAGKLLPAGCRVRDVWFVKGQGVQKNILIPLQKIRPG
jgi:hypothetical protein